MSVSYPTSGGTIPHSSLGTNFVHKHVSTDTTNKVARWELYDGSTIQDNSKGFTIRWNSTSSKNEINVNDTSGPYYNDGTPMALSINYGNLLGSGTTSSWHEISDGDSIQFFDTSSNPNGASWGNAWTVQTANHLWSSGSGAQGGGSAPPPTGQPTAPIPSVTSISFTKTQNYSMQVDFTYNNIRVSPNSPTTDIEYIVIKNVTTGVIVWSEHVSSAVTQPATRSLLLDVSPNGTYANKFGHGNVIQIMHTDYNGDKTDYDGTILYGDQNTHTYVATGPFDVTFEKVPGYSLFNLQVRDLNPFPDNSTRVIVKDLDGNAITDNQGDTFGLTQSHDLNLNTTPMWYLSCGLNTNDVKPFVKLYLVHFYSWANGSNIELFHSNLKAQSKCFSNFW